MKATLTYIVCLPEAGTIRERAYKEVELLAQREAAVKQIETIDLTLKAIRKLGDDEARKGWTAQEIRDAKKAAARR